jgi:hypothetical protein
MPQTAIVLIMLKTRRASDKGQYKKGSGNISPPPSFIHRTVPHPDAGGIAD